MKGINATLTSNETGGGGGGTKDYTELEKKPSINGVTLQGDKTGEELGLDDVKYVSTFEGVTGSSEKLYYLDTNYDEYTIGFYRYIEVEEAGVTVGKFIHTGNPHQLQVTYAKLKEMRDNAKLTAGMNYRITDYQCTTTQADTQSANHPFDIIVTADSASKLNEEARAALHNGDTYFANNDLEAWQLKYCLDNDTSRFNWADTTNGKGVVYYMKDEFGNECQYDFKNVQFKRWKVKDSVSGRSGLNGNYVGIQGTSIEKLTIQSATNFIWAYTFSSNANGGGQADYSLEKSRNVYGNVIGYANGYLNNCVFYGANCYGNTIGINARSNTFCGSCFRNTFGGYIIANAIGGSFIYNMFDSYIVNNSFGTQFSRNSVGDNFQMNIFGNFCSDNVFGATVQFNTFGNYCVYNVLGQNCYYNTFGSYLYYIDVSGGVKYCNVNGGASGAARKNAKILEGVMGTSTSKRLEITFKDSMPYTQFAAMTTDGKLRIWNPADEFEEKENIIDVTVLPTTDIDPQALYRLTTTHYYHNGTELANAPQGYKSLNEEALVADENGLTAIEGETSTTTPWAEVTDAMIVNLVSGSLVAACEYGEAGFFKTAADEYDYEGNFSMAYTYTLWHNATGEPTDWVEVDSASNLVTDGETTEDVDGELRANAIIDVDVFPTSGIKEATFYRKREDHFIDASDNEVVAIAKYICDGEHLEAAAVGLIDKSTGIPTPWAALTDAIVDGYVASGYCRVTEALGNTPNSLYFIKTGTDAYAHLMCIQTKSLYHHEDGAWKLVSEDSAPDGVTIETVANKLQANTIIDVTTLPTTGIKAKTLYRMFVHRYLEDGEPLAAAPTGYVARGTLAVVDENGITDTGVSPAVLYPWDEIDDDRMEWLIMKRIMREVASAELMTVSTCFKTATNHYVYKTHVTEEEVYELYHNPTATAGEFVKIGGGAASVETDNVTTQEVDGKLQANAIIEVQTLPATGYKQNSLYRMLDIATQTFKRYYYNASTDPLPETPEFYKGDGEHVTFGADNVTVNGSATSYDMLTEIQMTLWINNGWVEVVTDFAQAGAFKMPTSLVAYDSATKLTEDDYVVTAEMDKVFKRVQGGWECISYIQLDKEQYDILSEAQKNDGTLYIVNDEED